ncbi:MAG: PadR family transcriptional regulator [Pseudomonadota bacterium]
MSLKHILLGILREPQSGYDIKNEFNRSLKNFWNANLSQIYPELKKLETNGLLRSKQVESASGPNRRVYRRTAKGNRELKAWLQKGPSVGEERIGYLAQVYFLSELDSDAERIEFMKELRDHMAHWLDYLESAEKGWSNDDPRYPDALPDEFFYAQFTLDLGIRRVRATLEWCNDSIARIEHRVRDAARSA